MGVDGMRRSVVNSVGREVGRLEQTDAVPGKPIRLTIDYDLQLVAEEILVGKKGAVVALDPEDGEVLAMASQPSYDPNDFAVRISKDEWQSLNEDPEQPLLDRAIQAQLAPGSIFKILMATAMLESKAIPADYHVFCPGYGRILRPRVSRLEERRTTARWICTTPSCNPATSTSTTSANSWESTAFRITPPNLGLGRKTGVDLPGEEPGLMPSEEWKERVFIRSGIRARRSPSPSAKARSWSPRCNLPTRSAASSWAACSTSPIF